MVVGGVVVFGWLVRGLVGWCCLWFGRGWGSCRSAARLSGGPGCLVGCLVLVWLLNGCPPAGGGGPWWGSRPPAGDGVWSGGLLLSHTLPRAVPSALEGLTSGFGMGPGVSLSLWPPEQVRDTNNICFVVVLVCVLGYLIVDASSRCCCCVASPRPISIGQLHTLLCFHVRPIDPVVCRGPYHLDGVGVLILKRASRLDAFSGYHFPT